MRTKSIAVCSLRKPRVAIVDYRMCNLFSVKHACSTKGFEPVVTSDFREIEKSDAVVLPGVGAFGDAMKNLRKLDLIKPLQDASVAKPFMGICLGLQLLFDGSSEFGHHEGLGIVKGRVRRFSEAPGFRGKVPQIGWNRVHFELQHPITTSVESGSFFYFVHSFYVDPEDESISLASARYGGLDYCCAIFRGSLCGFQFHPEKSGLTGLQILGNWKGLIAKNSP